MKHPESVAEVRGLNLVPAVIDQLVEELPELGGTWTCCWCGWKQHIPEDYRGLWMVRDSCGSA